MARLGAFSGGRGTSVGGSASGISGGRAPSGGKLGGGKGVGPKLGRNLSSVGPRVGRSVIGKSDETGGLLGKARLRVGPRGMSSGSPRGLMNR